MGYYPSIVVLGSSGSHLAPLTSRGKSSESDDGSRVKLIREPALQKVGSREQLDGPPLNHLGTRPWRRRVVQAKGGEGVVSGCSGQPGRGIASGASNPEAALRFPATSFHASNSRSRGNVHRLRVELPGGRAILGYKPSGQRWGQPAGAVTHYSRPVADGRC